MPAAHHLQTLRPRFRTSFQQETHMQNNTTTSQDGKDLNAVPHTPGQAEGSENPDKQSKTPLAPQQPDQAEGEAEDDGQ